MYMSVSHLVQPVSTMRRFEPMVSGVHGSFDSLSPSTCGGSATAWLICATRVASSKTLRCVRGSVDALAAQFTEFRELGPEQDPTSDVVLWC